MSKIKTKEYTVYDINDIKNNEELKNKILENNRYMNVDHEWEDGIFEYWKDKLESIGFNNPKIEYYGFYSQGDGASFTCDSIDIKKFVENNNDFSKREKNILNTLYDYGYIEASVKRTNFHYSHENSTSLFYYDGDLKADWVHIQKIVDKLRNDLRSKRLRLSIDIYNDLKECYEDLTSDNAILETIEANNYEFDEDGNIE